MKAPVARGVSEARYGFRAHALELKAAIPISRYAQDVGFELKPAGLRLVGLCPFHSEKTPSFTVYADSSYYCFGCQATGDVIDLHAHLDGHPSKWTAVIDLAQRYNVQLPEKPKSWCQWQDQKAEARATAIRCVAKVYQRRLTKVYTPLVLLGGETPEEELEHLEELSRALWPVSYTWAKRRVEGEL